MRRLLAGFVAATVMVALGACQIAERSTAPTPGKVELAAAKNCTLTNQADWDALTAEALALYVDGSPSENQALAKISNLIHQCTIADYAEAEERALDLAYFTLQKWEQGSLAPGVTEAQVHAFIDALMAAAGVATDAWVVEPTDDTQTFYTSDRKAALTVSGSDVDATTIITAEELPIGQSVAYLNTPFDQYPRYYRFEKHSLDGTTTFNNPVGIAICVKMPSGIAEEVFNRVQLGHQHASEFSVADPTTVPSGLNCEEVPFPSSSTRLQPGATGARIRSGASGVAPVIIDDGSGYGDLVERGGVGGLADNFSDFGVVDPYADARGGVGGLADNYRPGTRTFEITRRLPSETVAQSTTTATCTTPIEGYLGSELPPECRPTVTVVTPIGNTNLFDVPVTFTVTGGGGAIAMEDPATGSCVLPFGSTVEVPTAQYTTGGATQARICWTLGPAAGSNTVLATVAPGGDAEDAAGFIYESSGAQSGVGIIFTATGLRLDPTATATGSTFTYDGLPHAGSGTCSHGLTPVLSYNTANGTAPVNAGSYEVTVTCGDGGVLYNTKTATATITIDKAAATATAGSATIDFGDPVPTIPCTVTGLLAADAGTVTCTTNPPTAPLAGVHTIVPIVNPSDPTNYQMTLVNGTLTVRGYVQVGCFDSPVYSVMPPTKAAQRDGSNIPIKCSLTWPNGSAVKNATGNLEVWSAQLDGTPIQRLFTLAGAFTPSNSGNYSYGLDTGLPGFDPGGAYYVKAVWNDGSTTTGYFRLK